MTNKTLLFIDESGKPDLEEQTQHFILTGVIVPEAEIPVVSGYFSYIKRRYSVKSSFHSYELLEKPNTKLGVKDGKNFVRSMCEFIESCPVQVFLIHTDKKEFIRKFKEELEITKIKLRPKNKGTVYFLSAYKQFQLLTDFVGKNNSIANIYADSRYNQDRDILDAYLKIRDRQLTGGILNPYGEKSQKLLTSLTFANKFSLTAGLELADFISFTSFAKIQRKLTQFQDIQLYKNWKTIEGKLVRKKIFRINPGLMKHFCQ